MNTFYLYCCYMLLHVEFTEVYVIEKYVRGELIPNNYLLKFTCMPKQDSFPTRSDSKSNVLPTTVAGENQSCVTTGPWRGHHTGSKITLNFKASKTLLFHTLRPHT